MSYEQTIFWPFFKLKIIFITDFFYYILPYYAKNGFRIRTNKIIFTRLISDKIQNK